MTSKESRSVLTVDSVSESTQCSSNTSDDDDEKIKKKNKKESFWSRIWNDFCNRELLPLKILFFVKAGTVFVLYPYLNLHLKSLGLEAEEAGLSNALTILTIIGQPLAGVISDKIGNFKVFLSVITLITPIPALLMLTIPLARETVILPHNMTFSLGCQISNEHEQQTHLLTFESLDPYVCITNDVDRNLSLLKDTFFETGTHCMCSQSNDGGMSDHNKSSISLIMPDSLPLDVKYLVQQDSRTSLSLEQDDEKDTIQRPSSLLCEKENSTEKGGTTSQENCLFQVEQNYGNLKFSVLKFTSSFSIQSENRKNMSRTEQEGRELKFNRDDLQFSVEKPNSSNFTTYPEYLCKKDAGHLDFDRNNNCTFQCFTILPRALFCSNSKIVKTYNENLTFWLYNVLRVFLGLFSSTCWILFEGAVLAIMKEKNGDYGLQRVTSQIAAIIAAPLSGFMIAYFDDFRPAFYLYGVLQVLCAVLSMKINLEFKQPSGHIMASLLKKLQSVKVIALFLAVFFSGTVWGFLESFLFWFLQNLGGDGFLMGLTITVGGLAGLPFLVFNKPIIDRVGHANIVAIGLIFYGIRLVGYSFIKDPWMCLPYESLEAITASLAITAANTYASKLASEDTVVSIQGIIGALYYSVGRSVGSLIGGFLIKLYGDVSTYRIMAIMAFCAGLAYFFFNIIYNFLRKSYLKNENHNRHVVQQRTGVAEVGTVDRLKFDGGYVGPFLVAETES